MNLDVLHYGCSSDASPFTQVGPFSTRKQNWNLHFCAFVLFVFTLEQWQQHSHVSLWQSVEAAMRSGVDLYLFQVWGFKELSRFVFLQVLNFSNVITLHKKERCIKHIYFFRGKKHEKMPHLRPQGFFIIFLRGCSAYLENYWSKYLIFFIISW